MDSESFREGIRELSSTAIYYKTAIMCSEAVWWRCHRGLISDYLKAEGWIVMHIMALNKLSSTHIRGLPASSMANLVILIR